jgi:hypothetical protein
MYRREWVCYDHPKEHRFDKPVDFCPVCGCGQIYIEESESCSD